MEQNREPSNKPMPIWTINMTKKDRTYNGVKTVYSVNGVVKIVQICAKNEISPPFYTIYKNKFKWIKDFNVTLKTLISEKKR